MSEDANILEATDYEPGEHHYWFKYGSGWDVKAVRRYPEKAYQVMEEMAKKLDAFAVELMRAEIKIEEMEE